MFKKIAVIAVILVLVASAIGLIAYLTAPRDLFEECANSYFSALTSKDYDAMYSLFTPAAAGNVSLESVKDYYKRVYDILKVTDVDVRRTENIKEDSKCVFGYVLLLKTAEYGNFELESSVTVEKKIDFYLIDWTPANVVPQMMWYDTVHKRTIKGTRGEIFDCNGKVLIKNAYGITIYFNMNKVSNINQSAEALAAVLSLDKEELAASMEKAKAAGHDTVVAAVYVQGDGFTEDKEKAVLAVEGARIDRSYMTPVRMAVYGENACHLLGYSTPVTQEDRALPQYAGLSDGTRVGRTGIELIYDSQLRGTDGMEIYLVSADASSKRVLYKKEPVAGKDIKLTIDINLQQTAQQEMNKNCPVNGSVGAVTVTDPKTGAVKVLLSYPSFNLNIYAAPIPKPEAAELIKDKSLPLLNRATQGLYPPGSVFKTISAVAGLESGTVTMNTAFPYENQIVAVVSGKTDGWRPEGSQWSHMIIREHMRGSASYGALNMTRALVFSDNIYFGWMGMKAGAETMIDWYTRFGMGEQLPFELSVAKSQISNDPNNEKLHSNLKFLADTTYGHGELLVTPLQLLTMFSVYGNNGTIMTPFCVEGVCSTDSMGRLEFDNQTEARVYKQSVCQEQTVKTISRALEKVTIDGTGKAANVKNMQLISKTGTAQKSDTEEIGWFASYIADGGTNYSALVCINGPKNDTGTAKCAVIKAIFLALQDPQETEE